MLFKWVSRVSFALGFFVMGLILGSKFEYTADSKPKDTPKVIKPTYASEYIARIVKNQIFESIEKHGSITIKQYLDILGVPIKEELYMHTLGWDSTDDIRVVKDPTTKYWRVDLPEPVMVV